MEQQRHGPGGNRRRRRKHRNEPRGNVEPVMIAARRPNSPLLQRGNTRGPIVASAAPAPKPERARVVEDSATKPARSSDPPQRRTARIVQAPGGPSDEAERNRQRLLARLMTSDGRGAITRAAKEYRQAGFEFPLEQEVQLQLLEHFDEEQARGAIRVLAELIEREQPLKKPVLEQRLRRLEEYAEEAQTRDRAAELRRALRSRGDSPAEARTRLST